jgi:hypothetical protein
MHFQASQCTAIFEQNTVFPNAKTKVLLERPTDTTFNEDKCGSFCFEEIAVGKKGGW